ncbi:MAG: hypothetical protein KAX24_01160 [Anaerolineae bacterium]|nr:hypothetical protein [Anaerolineae bacterium]
MQAPRAATRPATAAWGRRWGRQRALSGSPIQQVIKKRWALEQVAAAQKSSEVGFRHGDWRRELKDALTVWNLAKEIPRAMA